MSSQSTKKAHRHNFRLVAKEKIGNVTIWYYACECGENYTDTTPSA
jgi:hypothetical protein